MDTADLTPAPLRHIGGLFPAVRRMPTPPPDAGVLYAALCADFPDSDSLDYLADLARGVNAPIRLFALSLLPPLLSAAGVTSAGCSLRRDANGRPFLLSRDGAALNADFSLSHSAAHHGPRREALCKQDGGGQPLRFDSAAPPPDVQIASFCLPDTGAFLSVCLPLGMQAP